MNTNIKNIEMFYTALQDCFKEDEDRNLDSFGKINLKSSDGGKLIFEMFIAVFMLFSNLCDEEVDTLEFLSLINRMIFQDAMERREKEANE